MYKLLLNKYVLGKIEEWCSQLPTLEWSGTLFYKVETKGDDVLLIAKDIFVSDIGTATYTEFDNNEDIVAYQDENDLLDCYCSLIHSHNQMGCQFSGTDINTLQERGSQMPRFLSLIVNNAGTYNAKITKQLVKSSRTYKSWGNTTIEEESDSIAVDWDDVQIIKEIEKKPFKEDVAKRIAEIRAAKQTFTQSVEKFDEEFGADYDVDSPLSLFPKSQIPPKTTPKVDLALRYLTKIAYGNITEEETDLDDLEVFFNEEADEYWKDYIDSIPPVVDTMISVAPNGVSVHDIYEYATCIESKSKVLKKIIECLEEYV